jgi:hypothetical protein
MRVKPPGKIWLKAMQIRRNKKRIIKLTKIIEG